MATAPTISHVTIGGSISADPVPHAPFVPNDGNLLPKWPSQLDDNSWEEWQMQAMAADGSAAVVVILFRHTGNAPAGFRVGINASWAGSGDGKEEETVWCNAVALPHSVITSDPATGRVTGVWRGEEEGTSPHVSFDIAADLSGALVTFDLPDKLVGTIALTSLGYDSLPRTEAESKFMPTFWWVRPIAMASVTADLTFFPLNPKAAGSKASFPKSMQLREERGAFGSMERAWSTVPMAKCFSQSWWLWARTGPYVVQIIWIAGRPEADGAVWATGRLYRDGEQVSAPQRAVAAGDATDKGEGDSLALDYLYDEGGIRGQFRLKNVGHRIVFRSRGKTWMFEARHVRPWYNLPTSPPGPSASGLSGFVLSVSGGLAGSEEDSQGPGITGGGTMP